MGTVTLFAEALAHGGRVLWDPPERPKLILPKGVKERLETDRETVREILRRASLFRVQAETFIRQGRVLPLLTLTDHEGGCLSCGGSVEAGHWRCEVCILAVKLALEGVP